jgi:hypothetical protein
MPGWTYDDVRSLPRDVYEVLVESMNALPREDVG